MLRLHLCCLFVVILSVSSALAEDPKPIQVWLTPAKPPTPALRYQLLPDARVITAGNAATYYMKIVDLLGQRLNQKYELFQTWQSLPLDRLPREMVRKELQEFSEVFALLDKGARCDHCDWGLLERLRAKGAEVLLPDIQVMRHCAMLLAIRARLEMAEAHVDNAVDSLRTGFALARHVGEGDVLINFLVGVAIAVTMNEQLDDIVGQPGAPNLYYALTDLPVPLIDIHKGLQGERLVAYGNFPGLAAVGADRNAGNLSEEQLAACAKKGLIFPGGSERKLSYLERAELTDAILKKHDAAKQALVDAGRPKDRVEAMPHLQVALLHSLLEYDAVFDKIIVWHNLPYWELKERVVIDYSWPSKEELAKDPLKQSREDRLKNPTAPAIPLAQLMSPAITSVFFARARLERKIAMLRIIEALRYHAATHDGKLPATLSTVKEVPIPIDPLTGQAFRYAVVDNVATLTGPAPDKELTTPVNSVVYEVHIRK